jgi:flagellar biogenesis protein FliO
MLKAPSALIASRSRWIRSPSGQARLAANVSSALLAVLAFLILLAFLIWRRRLA